MRIYQVPARYLPELELRLGQAMRAIRSDLEMRALTEPGEPMMFGPHAATDESKAGEIVILVGELPAEQSAKVFAIGDRLQVAS